MTFELLDIARGDVLAEYDSLETARERLSAFVEEHPERSDELAIATIDDAGHAVGDLIVGTTLVGHTPA